MDVPQISCGIHRGVHNALACSVSYEKFFCPSNRGNFVVGCGPAVQSVSNGDSGMSERCSSARRGRYGKQKGDVLNSHIW